MPLPERGGGVEIYGEEGFELTPPVVSMAGTGVPQYAQKVAPSSNF